MKVFVKVFELFWNFYLEKKVIFLLVKLYKRDNCGIVYLDLYVEIILFVNGNYLSVEMGFDVRL